MVQIIAGEKGKGKTKILLDKVNADIEAAKGSIVFLDKSNKHMYELNNKIRLINVEDYCVENAEEFTGFICGIISQDHDIEKIYIDSFMKIVSAAKEELDSVIDKLSAVSDKFGIDIVMSFSANAETVSETVKSKIIVAL